MWIFAITPDWVFHTLFYGSLLATLAGFFLGKVRFLQPYLLTLKIAGPIVLVCSIFLEGALFDYNVMQARIEEVKQQVATAEKESKESNDKLAKKSTEVKQKIQVKKEYITRYIEREVTKYDNQCVIPKPFVDAHNQSAEKAK